MPYQVIHPVKQYAALPDRGIKQNQFENAWADFDAAARTEPDNASYLYGRGIAAIRLGRAAEGAADLANAIRLDANIAKSYAERGISP